MTLRHITLLAATFLSLGVPLVEAQSTSSFKDVKAGTSLSAAVEYLKGKGIIAGYSDGTFRPNNKVLRAEALKIIVSAVAADSVKPNDDQLYTDVPVNVWFAPYVSVAQRQLGIIDGPPKTTTFRPTAVIHKAEFLKLLLGAYKVDSNGAFSDITLPIASDVSDMKAWYYPYMRYALASSITMVSTDGKLSPDSELTRANIADMMYRYLAYRETRRLQALLSETETELVNVLQMISAKNGPQAELASARALIASRGALASKSDNAVVQGAVKTAEAFRSLSQGFTAGSQGRLDDAINFAKEAWSKADRADDLSPSVAALSAQLKVIATNMANEARTIRESGAKK